MFKTQFLRIMVVSTIFSACLFFSGCDKQSIEDSSSVVKPVTGQFISPKNTGDLISITEIRKISKIQDPQVIAEVDWMYKNNHMSKEQFCELHNKGVDIEHVNMWGYPNNLTGEGNDVDPWPRTFIQKQLKAERNDPIGARHQVFSTMYGGGTISIRVLSSVPSDWKTAISQACAAWNTLGYNVQFSVASVSTNVQENNKLDIIYYSLSPACTYAQRSNESTIYGYAEAIAINSTYACNNSSSISASAKKAIMMHELGHAIGLAHTDEWDAAGVTGVPCAVYPNTDASSIMRKYLPPTTTGYFTSCDLQVINNYWGANLA